MENNKYWEKRKECLLLDVFIRNNFEEHWLELTLTNDDTKKYNVLVFKPSKKNFEIVFSELENYLNKKIIVVLNSKMEFGNIKQIELFKNNKINIWYDKSLERGN